MKASRLIFTLLLASSVAVVQLAAQQPKADQKPIEEVKAKAEAGDAESQVRQHRESGGANCWASQFQCSVSQQTINNRLGLLLKGSEEFLIPCLSVVTALVCLESLLLILN